MPTEEATRVKCPECGATVHAAEGASVTKCEYCGVESRVQRRSQFFQIPIRLPTPLPDAPPLPKHIAVQTRRVSWFVGLIFAAAFLLPVLIPLTCHILEKRGFGANMLWNSGMQIVADVDGDGYDDVIGYGRYVGIDAMKLKALSGKDGHTIWETDSLGTYTERYQDKLAIVNGVLLRADTEKRALIEGFELGTGAKKWSQPTAEVVDKLCQTSTGVVIVTKDKRGWTFEPNSGALSPAAVDADDCRELAWSARWRDSRGELHRDVKIDGLHVDHVLGAHAPFIALATKQPGSRIPMLAAFDDGEHLLWKTEVPGANALSAKQGEPEHVAFDDKDIVVLYEKSDNHELPVVVCFDRASGQRRWEVPVKHDGDMFISVDGVALGSKMAFAYVESSVQAFDRATGKFVWYEGKLN